MAELRLINRTWTRPCPHRVVMLGSLGITLWRKGAVSLQLRGHFLQIVFGDWWGPWKERV